jgi:L-threonylcarbamoyladenylate synthase
VASPKSPRAPSRCGWSNRTRAPENNLPRVLKVDPALLRKEDTLALNEAARILRAGGLVAFPTETVYGLGARVMDESAIARVFAAKGRPHAHPLIAHVTSIHAARQLARSWNDKTEQLAKMFWPGALTLIVDRAPHVPASVAGGGDSIAIRSPSHPIAVRLIETLGDAIAAPSANRYQSLSPTLASHVVKSLGDSVDLVIDGGPCDAGIESTVVDARGPTLVVLRPGAISLAKIHAIDPDTVLATDSKREGEAHVSPGMDARHYAPSAKVVVAKDRAEAIALATDRARRTHPLSCAPRRSRNVRASLFRDPPRPRRSRHRGHRDRSGTAIGRVVCGRRSHPSRRLLNRRGVNQKRRALPCRQITLHIDNRHPD